MTLNIVFLVVNGFLFCGLCYSSWVAVRLVRHLRALDELLATICVKSYAEHHLPVWHAWKDVMGEFDVTVKPVRYEPHDFS